MSRKISAPHLHLICRETKLLQRSFAKKGNLIVGVGDDNEDNDDDMMMMMMNCFCGMVDRQKAFSLISNWGHCQRSSPPRISGTPQAGFEPALDLLRFSWMKLYSSDSSNSISRVPLCRICRKCLYQAWISFNWISWISFKWLKILAKCWNSNFWYLSSSETERN